jgi:pilus assembly protein CpaF
VTNLIDSIASQARRLAVNGSASPSEAIEAAIDQAFEAKKIVGDAELERNIHRAVTDQITGFGSLQTLIEDESVEEIWVNAPDRIFVARAGQNQLTDIKSSESEIRGLIERMLRSTGRRVDRTSPFVDATLEDGSRLHVAIPDVTAKNWSVNIRKFPSRIWRLAELVQKEVLSHSQANLLRQTILAGGNILVSGATQAGKTTLLCALLTELPKHERLISVEDTFEIRATQTDWVALQTRPENLEGHGAITLRRLIKEALRMRPSRIVVGEVREAESLDLLIALNSGLPGMCTIHANSAADAISKLCTLPLLAGQNIPSDFIRPTVANCIDLVVHCRLERDGTRRVSEIASVAFVNNEVVVVPR